jgi:trimeric autotransporter adhesin
MIGKKENQIRSKSMKPINPKARTPSRRPCWASGVVLVAFALSSFALMRRAGAVTPAPDGGYLGGNTAEGQNALFSLTSGAYNTAVGFLSLRNDAEGQLNTAIGAGTLLFNTAHENTATGAGALLSNTTGSGNTANGTFALVGNIDGSENSAFGWHTLAANTTGFGNTATGANALRNNTEGGTNTATGVQALFTNTTGQDNTASGYQALFFNDGDPNNGEGSENSAFGAYALGNSTTGSLNSAFGWSALGFNTIGSFNTAIGGLALSSNSEGSFNTAVGREALVHATGTGNTGLGDQAGLNITTANNVICIGTAIGGQNIDNSCFIGNIYSNIQPVIGTDPDYVTIDHNGRLGRSNLNGSSRRFKHDIQPMNKASEVIFALRPVSFYYNKEYDATQRLWFGLIAEEVAEVDPELVGRNKKGEPESVRYEQINAMLLNEFLKEHRKVQEQAGEIQEQKATISELKKGMETVVARLQEQESKIQRVNAELQMSQVVRRTSERIRRGEAPPQAIVNNSGHPN